MSSNNLDKLDLHTFEGLANLESLDLNSNKLKYITRAAFRVLHNLKACYLNDNKIVNIDMNAFAKGLTKLFLGYNKIQNVIRK